MAGPVFFSVTMSLDGFVAPEPDVTVGDVFSPGGQDDPRVRRWLAQWSQLQAWVFPLRWFRENLKLGEGGEEGLDDDIARATFERTGASVMAPASACSSTWTPTAWPSSRSGRTRRRG